MKPPAPSSDAFWILSWGYRDAGDATFSLLRSDHPYTGFAVLPCVFLYFRSIELALKAVLTHHGLSDGEIRALGHRLSPLLLRAETYASLTELGISSQDRELLDRFSSDYSEKWFEYPDDVSVGYPTLEELRDVASRLCDTIRAYKLEKA